MGYKAELKQMVSIIRVNLAAIDTVSTLNDEEDICDMVCAINGPINQLKFYVDNLLEEDQNAEGTSL
jgi:hypothetical protein